MSYLIDLYVNIFGLSKLIRVPCRKSATGWQFGCVAIETVFLMTMMT